MANTKTNKTEQMRRLENTAVLAGPIAEILSYKKDKTKDKIDYISFSGVIRCGENPAYDTRFKIFSTAKKKDKDGNYEDRPNYTKLKKWCDECIPMTKSTESCTWAEMGGYLAMNDYVSADGKLVEGLQININWVNNFTDYKADIDLEALYMGERDETKGEDEEPTGRKRVRLVGADIFGNAVELKNAILDEENVDVFNEAGYATGSFAKYFISLIPNQSEPKAKTGGVGRQRVTRGKTYLEYVIVGADPIIEEDDKDFVETAVFKALMNERKSHLAEVEAGGYQGNNGDSDSNTSKGGVGKTRNSKSTEEDIDNDDMPF